MLRRIIPLLFLLILSPTLAYSAALALSKDASGWTVFTPSDDSRIMYVSSSGNDTTGAIYDDGDALLNGTPFTPGAVLPFATYAAAYANTREGYPDWILIKRGDTLTQNIGSSIRNGRSTSEPFLVGAYGSSGTSPILKIGSGYGIRLTATASPTPETVQYIAVSGIRFYAHTRNPADPSYVGIAGELGLYLFAYNTGNTVRNILIEGCAFLYPESNVIQSGNSANPIVDIDIRRTVFAYSHGDTGSHYQGLYATLSSRLLLEENIFDHNGWLVQSYDGSAANGQATEFNHNTYFASNDDVTFRGNIFARPSSSNNKFTAEYGSDNIVLENNLYLDDECVVSMGQNYPDNEWRFGNPVISNNVVLSSGISQPTDRNLSWGFWLGGWDGGSVYNNIYSNAEQTMSNSFALQIWDQSRDVDIYNNIFFSHQTSGQALSVNFPGTSSGVTLHDNYFEMTANGVNLVESTVSLTGLTFSNNQYYDPTSPTFNVLSSNYTTAQWTSGWESSATYTQRTFPDKTRDVESYQSSIGETATLSAFLTNATAQDRFDWDTRYEADSVNDYIRGGFGFATSESVLTGGFLIGGSIVQ